MATPHSKLTLQTERIENFITNVLKTGKDKRTADFLKARIQLIHSYWTKFQETHDNLYEAATGEALKSFDTDAFYNVEHTYMETVGWLHDQINQLKPQTNDEQETLSNPNTSSFIEPKQVITNLPKLHIPTFAGSYLEWPSFRATFQSLIHENDSISQIQKMHYLKSAVSGEAATLIKHLSIMPQNYISAWGVLVARYENKRVLVNSNLKLLLSIQNMSTESFNEIRRVHDGFTQAVTQLKNLERPVIYWDDWLVFLLSQKLDPNTRKDWENSISHSTEIPAFTSLCDFLASRLHTLQALNDNPMPTVKTNNVKHGNARPAHTYPRSYHVTSGRQCLCCREKHLLLFCPKFRAKSTNERLEFLRLNNSCYNCLGSNHNVHECPSMNRCKHCKQKHHTMIHGHHNFQSSTSTQSEQTPACPMASPTRAHLSCSQYTSRRVLLTTASILVQSPEGRTVRARALLDQCSESNFITASLANTLRLRKNRIRIPVLGVAECNAGIAEAFATHNILTSSDPPDVIPVQSLILPTLAHLIPAQKIQKSTWPHIMNLQLADPEFHTPSRIDLILGVDVYDKVLLDEVRRGPDGTPLAQATALGWIVSGSVDKETSTQHHMRQSHCALLDVDRTLRRFWEIEDTPTSVPLTPQEEECENMFIHSHKRDEEGRYVVRLPTKSNALQLGDSRKVAVSALLRLEKRFAQDNNLHRDYSNFLEEYQTLGHLEHVVDEQDNALRQFYLPHHAILKPSSTTTKLRVVFNGSQKTSSGVSLNDLLHIGPKLQNDIFHVISKWRLYPLVLTADIEKMYRQIRVHTDDLDLQRILWRRTTQEPIRCYRLLTVTYGTACAPYLACRTLRQLCNDYQHEFPSAAKIVRDNFYVDDALFGAYDHQSALHIKTEVCNLLSKGGFKLRKWLTNSPELISDIPEEDREIKTQVKIVEDAQVKTLGLGWNPSQDKFIFQIHLPQQVSYTKRSILSDISRIYDPLGWLSPTTIIPKVFLQKLWLAKVDWDEELPEELSIKWNHYRQEMNELTCIQIDRWMGTTDPHNSTMNLQLHGFCDASLSAYAAVVYLRLTSGHHDARVSLLASKTRVSPLKTVSLPRLELCGATLLAELIAAVQLEPYFNNIPVYAWTDSTIVLTWLGEHPSRWKVFVANRVSTIHSITPQATWNHVPTDDNPADCATRGLSPAELQCHELWWTGPQWLRKSQECWPKRASNLSAEQPLEERRETTILLAHQQMSTNTLLHRYSNLGKLIRITAYCCRFIHNASHQPSQRQRGHLTVTEKNAALDRWLHIAQQSSYADEISDLTKGKPISSKSKIRNLTPFVDDQGFLRVGGRLKHATLSYAERCPIILHKDSHLTWLVIDYAHSRTLHGGTQLTLHHIRTRYWIPSGRNMVRQFIRSCIICYRYQAKAKNQIMSVLPRDRVRPSKPFTITGVDYAGPFKTKPVKGRGKTILKSYVAIFVCFATRAVHLELVLDLTTDSFLAAFKRFVARRGHCAKMYSDNATNFVGAARELDKYFHQLHQDSSLLQSLTDCNTEWHFIPPASPHFGGLWEAGVKSFKHHLRRVVGDHLLSIEETLTLVAQTEACLNSRPLSAISDDPEDLQALTPAHFLIGCNLFTVPESSLIETPVNRLTRWQLVQAMYEHLWQRWHKEYLQELQIRNKWSQQQDPVRINDLVLLKEDKLPPSTWSLGRITEVHPGDDGNIRVVTLKHKNGYCKRPIVKICVLPINTSDL